METKIIIGTLLAAAALLKRPVQEITSQSLKDAYAAATAYLRKKLEANPDAVDALDMATEKPESLLRKALLVEESSGADLAGDVELAKLIDQLAELMASDGEWISQSVQVTGRNNRVQVAGRDFINAEKIIERNTITPDERHLTVEQRSHLQELISDLASRLAGKDDRPNFAGVHRMLQKRLNVASYLLIPREQFAEALAFLKQQRAIHRSALQRRNPVACRNVLYRAIFAGARELKWDGKRVYQFAAEVIGLKGQIDSLKELGALQLKALAGEVHHRVVQSRRSVAS